LRNRHRVDTCGQPGRRPLSSGHCGVPVRIGQARAASRGTVQDKVSPWRHLLPVRPAGICAAARYLQRPTLTGVKNPRKNGSILSPFGDLVVREDGGGQGRQDKSFSIPAAHPAQPAGRVGVSPSHAARDLRCLRIGFVHSAQRPSGARLVIVAHDRIAVVATRRGFLRGPSPAADRRSSAPRRRCRVV